MAKRLPKSLLHKHATRFDLLSDWQRFHPFTSPSSLTLLKRVSFLLSTILFFLSWVSLTAAYFFFIKHNTTVQPLVTRPVATICFLLLSLNGIIYFFRNNIILSVLQILLPSLSFILMVIAFLSYNPFFQHIVYPYFAFFSPVGWNTIFQIAPNAGVSIILFSIACLLFKKKSSILVAQIFTLLGLLIVLPTDIGYLYGSDFIFGPATRTKLAISTTVALNTIGVILLCVYPNRGITGTLTSQTTAGYFARRFIIVAIGLPIVLGWLILSGSYLHFYNADFRFLLFISVTILTYLGWTFYIARSLQRLDNDRKKTQDTLIFLAQASKVLSSSLNYRLALKRIVNMVVPMLADWCSVDMLDEHTLKNISITYKDKRKISLGLQLLQASSIYQRSRDDIHPVLKKGKSELYASITQELMEKNKNSQEFIDLIQKLHIHSAMIVPIVLHRKVVGVFHFARSETKKAFTSQDLQVAQELALRAAIAIENATLYKNAQEAIQIRDEFISIASHELKTPLTSLKVYTEALLRKFQREDTKTAGYLQRMDQQINKLTGLIKDLLDVTRMQVGKLTLQFDKMNIEHLVQDTVSNIQLTTTTHKIEINGTVKKTIQADKERIGQVVANLLTNAIKYSPESNKVLVQVSESKKDVSVSVQDFGIGIDKEHIGKVFNRFYQVGSKKSANAGLGMGLYIAKEIIHGHGGTISVSSIKGKGSTFTITLPLKGKK